MKFATGMGLALALAWTPVSAQDTSAPTGAALTKSDIEAFSDSFMPVELAQGNIAGAVVVVVKDGQVLFEKGYGVADTKTRSPVDPETTLFRPGSVSKLFTWTAVMQLVDAGKIDLDKDVNTYLDFTIPPAFGKPVTMRDLMTHTAGFEETYRSLLIGNPRSIEPLDWVVKEALPARVFPPGEVPAYSNYGATLAGYIVQRVSGEKFEDYIQHHIFDPLGMTHATFVQPLPASLKSDMSKGYRLASGPVTAFEMISMGPAGGLSASGGSIARFMIAQLNDGAFGDKRILSETIAKKMHGVANDPFSTLSPMAYGFYHDDMNGHDVIAHGGDTGVFHSNLELILDGNTGVFISLNSAGEGRAVSIIRRGFMLRFMDRYFPAAKRASLPTLRTAKADGAKLAGAYVVSRRGETNFTRYLNVFQPIVVSVDGDGVVTVPILIDAAGQPKHWREVKPFVWQEVNGKSLVQAKLVDGKVSQIGTDDIGPIAVLMPAPFSLEPWNFYLLAATIAILALTVLFWPIKAVLRWRYDRPLTLAGRARSLYRLTRVVALVDLLALSGFPLAFLVLTTHLASLPPSIDWLFRGLQLLTLIGVVGTVIPVWEFVIATGDRARPWWTKATDLLIVLAALATVWFALSQHLLSIALNY
jgi:CubicO group peptidase (beta-lactamase class C family)